MYPSLALSADYNAAERICRAIPEDTMMNQITKQIDCASLTIGKGGQSRMGCLSLYQIFGRRTEGSLIRLEFMKISLNLLLSKNNLTLVNPGRAVSPPTTNQTKLS